MTVAVRQPFAPTGGFRELIALFFPIMLMTFSSCLFLFVEKLLLARLSMQAMEAALSAAYVCQIFQGSCVALAMMAQVSVGRWHGAQEARSIGPGIWQFIWFAGLSMLVTFPVGLVYGKSYFHGTAVEAIAWPYYVFMMAMNFLYPLGTALSCFYLGQGKTRLVLWASVSSQLIKLLLAYLLIFGWGWIPAFGILGGAFSTLVAQGGFCFILLRVFLNPKHAESYDSHRWQFQPRLFWECVYPGLLRFGNRILSFTSWAAIAHLMTAKGDDYLLILSIGGTVFLFLPFLTEALCQVQITVVSHLLGTKNYLALGKAFRSSLILVMIIIALIGIPLVVCPSMTLHYLFPKIALTSLAIQKICLGLWASFAFFAFGYIPISYILAFKDMKFSLFMGFVGWVNGYLFMALALQYFHIAADQFWLVLSIMHASTALFYLWRTHHLRARTMLTASTPAQ